MKSLILADLHYSLERYGSKVMSLKLKEESEKQKFDSVLLCGDNAIITKDMSNYFKLFDFLRENIS
ncbi:hypothetical protein HZA33_00895, partial [Candidatus Pacearchaeota archaeon]|nr:hypothetical protein [Candidatus Pacearchaeota archaeon]